MIPPMSPSTSVLLFLQHRLLEKAKCTQQHQVKAKSLLHLLSLSPGKENSLGLKSYFLYHKQHRAFRELIATVLNFRLDAMLLVMVFLKPKRELHRSLPKPGQQFPSVTCK